MSENKKRKRNAIVLGVVGLASIMGVATTGLVIGTSIGGKQPSSTENIKIDWAKFAGDKVSESGFNFDVTFEKGVLVISGDAKDEKARNNAFEAGKNAVLDKIKSEKLSDNSGVLAFENAITINGKKVDEVPDAASALGEKPQAEACQTAYNTLLDDRVINFNSGSAIISPDSQNLLNGLADVAKRCVDYSVEVGGHTDTKGDAIANQTLSENRAQAVADYLLGKGVEKSQLAIKGYGESKPLDTSETKDADAKNRRIEFKVEEKAK